MAPHAKELITSFSIRLYERGYTSSTGGNISMRVGDDIYVTPAGIPKYRLSSLDIQKINIVDPKSSALKIASREFPMHFTIYKRYPDVSAVVHAHPPNITALASMMDSDLPLPHLTPSFVAKVGKVRRIDFTMPGSTEFSESVVNALKDCNAVMIKNHGSVTVGADLTSAFEILEEVEDAAKIFLISGLKAQPISNEQTDKIRKTYGKPLKRS